MRADWTSSRLEHSDARTEERGAGTSYPRRGGRAPCPPGSNRGPSRGPTAATNARVADENLASFDGTIQAHSKLLPLLERFQDE